MLFPLAGLFRLDALGLGHSVYGRLQVVELGMHGLERLFHFLRDDGLVKPVARGDSADRADGGGPAHDERGERISCTATVLMLGFLSCCAVFVASAASSLLLSMVWRRSASSCCMAWICFLRLIYGPPLS